MSAIFISHHSSDKEASRRVAAALEAGGHHSIFLDFHPELGIPAGRDWAAEIAQKLRMCQALVLLCSPESMNSRWCFYEALSAQDNGKLIFPVIVKECEVNWPIQQLQWTDLAGDFEAGMDRLIEGLRLKGVAGPLEGRSPFPGLEAFDEEDAPFFFGRSEEIDRSEEELRQIRRFDSHAGLVFRGPSGSGKSSVLKAGLVPRLRTDDHRWTVVGPFRPGQRPLTELARAISNTFARYGKDRDRHELANGLAAAAPAGPEPGAFLQELCHDLMDLAGRQNSKVVFVIDQLEELAVASDRSEAERFCHLVTNDEVDLLLLGSVRSDLMGEIDDLFGPNVEFKFHRVNRLNDAQTRRAIVEPCRRAGVDIDDALVDRMAFDCQGRDALPMLAFVLERLYRRRSHQEERLTIASYEAVGGVAGALVQEAEGVYRSHLQTLGDAGLSETLLAMVRLSEDGTPVKQPTPLGPFSPAAADALEDFVAKRLLVADSSDDGQTVEIAHERLLTAWSRLNQWIRDGESALRARRDLARDAALWHQAGRPSDQLLQKSKLATVADLATDSLSPVERELIAASNQAAADAVAEQQRQEAKKRRRLRVTVTATSAAAVVMAALAVFGLVQTQDATRRQREAEAIAVTAESSSALTTNPALALGLALEGYEMAESPTPRQSQAIADAMLAFDDHIGQPLAPFEGHTDWVRAVAYSPDGKHIATASDDGTARIWETTTGTTTTTLTGHTSPVWAVAYSPDGNHITTTSNDGTARIWDTTTGTTTTTLTGHTSPVWAVAYSPDGNHITTTSTDGTARIWDTTTGTTTTTLTGHTSPVWAVAYSPDGNHITTASSDGTARIWDTTTGTTTTTLTGHTSPVWGVAYSPDGKHIATAGDDGTARIWDTTTGTTTTTLTGHTSPVRAVAYSPDGNHITTTSNDGTARIWDTTTGTTTTTLTGHTSPVLAVAYSPDGNHITTASSDGTARIWDTTTGTTTTTLTGHTDWVLAVAYSPDGNHITTTSSDGTARIWDTTTGTTTTTLTGHTGWVRAVAYSPDGNHITTTSNDGTARIWDTTTGTTTTTLTGHTSAVLAVAYSPDGNHITTTSEDGTARIWDTTTGTTTTTLTGHTSPVLAVAYSPDGNHITTTSYDGTARIWDTTTGTTTTTLTGHNDTVWAVAYSPDGNHITTTSSDGTARIWDTTTGTTTTTLTGHTGWVRAVAYSPDGNHITTTSNDGTARIWDTTTGTTTTTLTGHTSAVLAVAYSPDGNHITTTSDDGTVRITPTIPATEEFCQAVSRYLTKEFLKPYLPEGHTIVACTGLRE